MFGGRPAPPVSPHALRLGGTLPEVAAAKTPERPPEHLRNAVPSHRGGETSDGTEKAKPIRQDAESGCNGPNADRAQCLKVCRSGSFHLLQFCWQSEEVDRDMDFIMAVVKTIRSLRSDYKLTKTAADCKSTANSNYFSFAAGE